MWTVGHGLPMATYMEEAFDNCDFCLLPRVSGGGRLDE